MKKLILLFHLLLVATYSYATMNCSLTADNYICKQEKMSITFATDLLYDQVIINAFTQIDNQNIDALVQNQTTNSADIIFLAQGNGEIVIRYFLDGIPVTICNQNVFIFDLTPVPFLSMISDFLDDQVACESLDLQFTTTLECIECAQEWILNDESVNLEQETFTTAFFQSTNSRLLLDELGEYELCQRVYTPDGDCYIQDCINISIIEMNDTPSFSILNEDSINYCLNSELSFINDEELDLNKQYHWQVSYDSLNWNYYRENLDFKFLFPGDYTISLSYSLINNLDCISELFTKHITIDDASQSSISCSSFDCGLDTIRYRSSILCSNYNWTIDELLTEYIEIDDSIISIVWKEVEDYTETDIILELEGCSTPTCSESKRTISLYPETIPIYGLESICDNGTFTYTSDFIPNAEYVWNIEITENISGLPPTISSVNFNEVTLDIASFVGQFEIFVTASIPSTNCTSIGKSSVRRINIISDNNICYDDLFRASLLPKINEDIEWTLSNADSSYFAEQTVSGLTTFLGFGFPNGGTYFLNASIPSLDFKCPTSKIINLLPEPEVILSGPLFVCPNSEVTYSLQGANDNDIIEWTIFQNGTQTDYLDKSITINWGEDGFPFFIKVKRSTEVSPGQICASKFEVFEINKIDTNNISISGDETVCYDAISTYTVSQSGSYNWEINPPYMGTIISGQNTEEIQIQWHYAPTTYTATISYTNTTCDEPWTTELDIQFEPFSPTIIKIDSICQSNRFEFSISNLETYDYLEYYVNGILKARNAPNYIHFFNEPGITDIKFVALNPNDCPGLLDTTIQVFVKEIPDLRFDYSGSIVQCPKENYQPITASINVQNELNYYTWYLDGEIIKEGFGTSELYVFDITNNEITNNTTLLVDVEYTTGCTDQVSTLLNYNCDEIIPPCECIEEVTGSIEYVILHECNLVSFGGLLDLSSVIYAEWRIPQGDTISSIPIFEESDLTQDSILLTSGITRSQISIRVLCNGALNFPDGSSQDSVCDFSLETLDFFLYYPEVNADFKCNEFQNYDVTLENYRNPTSPPEGTYITSWEVNGISYEGESIELLNIAPETDLTISITQCDLDETYCCTNPITITTPIKFAPQIILPNGSCENDLWLFTLNENPNLIESIIWDFGDGSGSTLFESEKGFENTAPQTISVTTTNTIGCISLDTITIESFPNNINGKIEFESEPCSPSAILTYTEESNSTISAYEWSVANSANSSSINVNSSGTYSVTVTDQNGCTNSSISNPVFVNESLNNGILVDSENCGTAQAFISPNENYDYDWYINDIFESRGNSILINQIGELKIKVISIDNSTNEVCDSLIKSISIFPNPQLPILQLQKSLCTPLIAEIEVLNYDSVQWSSSFFSQISKAIKTSESGIYRARHTDINGCSATQSISITDPEVDFNFLTESCIQACREDLDSLSIMITGTNNYIQNWSWISLDTFGTEYTVLSGNGPVPDLLITEDMYQFIQLQSVISDCIYTSSKISLDIITCTDNMPPYEVICDKIDRHNPNCGLLVYECLVSQDFGGPKLYYEGAISTPTGVHLCDDNILDAQLNSGEIQILSYDSEVNEDGSLHIHYKANIYIDDYAEFEANETYIQFNFCTEDPTIDYCLEYKLSYLTCTRDFTCLIDYIGISQGEGEFVSITYCLNLSEVSLEDCTLEEYTFSLALTNDDESKIIHNQQIIADDFDKLICLNIPISLEDFSNGKYHCLETIISGDCPEIVCSDYKCGVLGNWNAMLSNENSESLLSESLHSEQAVKTKPTLITYPNPNQGMFTISFKDFGNEDQLIIKNALGQLIQQTKLNHKHSPIDLSSKQQGVYFVAIERNGLTIATKKILVIK